MPIDSLATERTVALYNNLFDTAQAGTMFGHQDATAYGIGWKYEADRSDVKSITGSHPQVYGWEIGGIERLNGNSLDDIDFAKIRDLAIEAFRRGGVNTFSWHLDNLATGKNAWDVGTNVVQTIVSGGENHDAYMKALALVADFFSEIKDDEGNPIPILFRPFHEHNKDWFWWGAAHCSPQEYKQLWIETVDYLKNTRGLHNILYVYSPDRVASLDEYIERYPGDRYVDILGLDLYHFEGAQGVETYITDTRRSLGIAKQVATNSGKPFVFSETGLECVTMPTWFSEVLYPIVQEFSPAYVLVWRNAFEKPNHYYAPYPSHPAAEDLTKFKNFDDILFQGETIDMYK